MLYLDKSQQQITLNGPICGGFISFLVNFISPQYLKALFLRDQVGICNATYMETHVTTTIDTLSTPIQFEGRNFSEYYIYMRK